MTTDAEVFEFESGKAAGSGAIRSLADRIKADLAERKVRTVDITHPAAHAWTVTYRVPTNGVEVDELRQRAQKKDRGKAVEVHFSRALLAAFCTGIVFESEQVTDEETGRELTFRDRSFQDLVGAATAAEAVAGLYGSDATVSTIASKLLDEAGYGDSEAAEVVDPTQAG